MRSTIGWLVAGVFMLAAGGTAWGAQQPNPSLTALDSGVDDEHAKSFALDIADLDVVVDIVGNVARTTVAARFTNARGTTWKAPSLCSCPTAPWSPATHSTSTAR